MPLAGDTAPRWHATRQEDDPLEILHRANGI
jgi:hypothetical protein